MAFTFLVEDGTGLTGANSYATVAEADDYLVANIHVAPIWAALDTASKEYLLAWASRYLDQRATWNGDRMVNTSGLRWPRTGVYTIDDVLIADDEVPTALKQATIEMARYLIASDRSTERDQDALKELQVDVVKLVFDVSYRLPKVPSEISYILRGLGTINSGAMNFARIIRA